MAGTVKRGTEVPTIDVALVTIKASGQEDEIAIKTSNKLAVAVNQETTDAIKLIVKNVLYAQKPEQNTVTGHTLTLTDNVFIPEVVKILQGGTITYDTVDTTKVIGYTPPVQGSGETGVVFELNAYSAIYNAAGVITGYEKITYPNCQGKPVALGSEDGVFRVNEYAIVSAPATGVAPYALTYLTALPTITA